MNQNLTFVIIASENDLNVKKTLDSISKIGKIVLVDGGPRKIRNSNQEDSISLKGFALMHSATYLERKYDYAAAQYNFGLSNVETEWAFIIDSDECISQDLKTWLLLGDFGNKDYFLVKRFNFFLNKKIAHGQFKPDWNIRLFKKTHCKYEDRKIHARMEIKGNGGKAPSYMEHYTVQTINNFVMKMIEFTDLENDSRNKGNSSNEFKALVRYVIQKFPFQPSLRFIYSYWVRLGFLDGKIGYLLARSASYYEVLVQLRKFEYDE